MKTLRLILGDQLSRSLSALENLDRSHDLVLMVEVQQEATYVRHHKQKIVLIFSAMRHFAHALREEDIKVDYVQLDDPNNTGSFNGELERAVLRHSIDKIVVTEPGEWRVWEMMQSWSKALSVPVEIKQDDRFLCSRKEFAAWTEGRKSLRMEFFYRYMRRKTGWLMRDDKPEGNQWNYDADNRKAIPKGLTIPARKCFAPDVITRKVMTLVETQFADHFGDLDSFGWAVTKADATTALDYFIRFCLPQFGNYQDAMKNGEDFLFHSALSPYLNMGLLTAKEVCLAALSAYENDSAPIASVEGFIRQILGWREYVRGIYWTQMPAYANSNFFQAERKLPDFYWTGNTAMHCLQESIDGTRKNAYAHHIQRLMITGNFLC